MKQAAPYVVDSTKFNAKSLFFSMIAVCAVVGAQPLPSLNAPETSPTVWEPSAFTLENISGAANPFDPDCIAVEVTFRAPSAKTLVLPAFWSQNFTRSLENNQERIDPEGMPGWRVRFTPTEPGTWTYTIAITQNGAVTQGAPGSFEVGAAVPGARGFAHVEPVEKRFFQCDDGKPLVLLGANACWPQGRGTYDYDDWFTGFATGRMNQARIWMWPLSMGIETKPEERLNYNLREAWRLEYVLETARRNGVFVMLCLDYHGMFQETKDMWGGNDYWPRHPYNQTCGGPCATQNDFFANPDAAALYRKRLRYLVARYSAEPALLGWEFFNEINLVYGKVRPEDCAAWHQAMGTFLKSLDPYKHPTTTSFGSMGEQPEMWRLDALDYAQFHLYLNWSAPGCQAASTPAALGRRFHRWYDKPMYIGEFGTSGLGFDQQNDPYLRGLRQALWSGLLGGTAGTAMPWWWEHIHANNLYGVWRATAEFLDGTDFGTAAWHPADVDVPRPPRPLAPPDPAAPPATAEGAPGCGWGERHSARLEVNRPSDLDWCLLPQFVHGAYHPELRDPWALEAHFAADARFAAHFCEASSQASVLLRIDGNAVTELKLPEPREKDRMCDVTLEAPIPEGTHTIALENTGGDWAKMDRIRLVNMQPSQAPIAKSVTACAMTDGHCTLAYVVNPRMNYPRGRDIAAPETLEGAQFTLRDLPDGAYRAQWRDPESGAALSETAAESHAGKMPVEVPPFAVDLAAKIMPVAPQ